MSTQTTCSKCHGTGFRSAPFYHSAKPCDCGWQPGGALRAEAEAEYLADRAAAQAARIARREARQAVK